MQIFNNKLSFPGIFQPGNEIYFYYAFVASTVNDADAEPHSKLILYSLPPASLGIILTTQLVSALVPLSGVTVKQSSG